MDETRFDALTKSLTTAGTRRGVLAAGVGGLASLLGLAETAAGKKKRKGTKKKKKKKKNDDPPCWVGGYGTGDEPCGDTCCNAALGHTCCHGGSRCCECCGGLCCDHGWRCSCNGTQCIPPGYTCCLWQGNYYGCPEGNVCGDSTCWGVSAP